MNQLHGKRIVIPGGAGFIGHNLALKLKALGADVTVIDSLAINNLYSLEENSREKNNSHIYKMILEQRQSLLRQSNIPIIIADARDYHSLCKIMEAIKPQIIIHLAAVSHANRSNKDPYSTFDHSMRTLENALDSCRNSKHLERFIYFSSSMVYGNFIDEQVTEDSVCNPLGIYGGLKFGSEKIVIGYNQAFGLPYTIIRPSALYGPRCISRRVLQVFLENVLIGEPLKIQGDGSDKLDFTYIDDLISGVICCIKNNNAKNQIFNITYGESRSLKDVINILKKQFPLLEVEYKTRDNLMPKRGTLSVNKAKILIDYNPKYSLEKGLFKYLKWYKDLPNINIISHSSAIRTIQDNKSNKRNN